MQVQTALRGGKTTIEALLESAIKTPLQKNLIVECDGHDFHEKRKEQAAKDKRRDRILQSLGYRVFRFTGSEIHNDAIACAIEAFKGFGLDPNEESSKPRPI
ncbi:MAG: endonuclease domain-containing protein [Acidobacteriota bacterium]|nr:endonuclease domain-containing protein [Acidobacteriota bacterium]